MAFTYKAHPKELIGREVNASYLRGNRNWVTSYGSISKFLSNNRVRLVHTDNSFSVRVFREEWGILTFDPQVGDTVYGDSKWNDPDRAGQYKFGGDWWWEGIVQEVHDDYVIVKLPVTGRLSRRKKIRPHP
jgi:hypothetical protein